MPFEHGMYVLLAPHSLEDIQADGRFRPTCMRLFFFYVMTRMVTRGVVDRLAKRGLLPVLEWDVLIQATIEVNDVGEGALWYFQGVFVNPSQALEYIRQQELYHGMARQPAACFEQLIEYGFEGYAYCDEDGQMRNSRVMPLGC